MWISSSFLVFRRRGQRAQDPRSKRRKIVDYRIPDCFDIHAVIPVPEPVAQAADVVWVFPERPQMHVPHKLADHIDAFEDVSQ
jgi:hypothetical protein